MTRISLCGCTTQPLGSYLKALAVLRLISEQVDPDARGWWENDCLQLDSVLDVNGLVDFFLLRYKPTPILAPWNGGSGFYPKDRKVGIDAIASATDQRFAEYRRAISMAQKIPALSVEKGASKAEEDERRVAVLAACRNSLPDLCVDWLDAAVGLAADGKRAFAPILGTGGNEGRLDYTNNFMENVANLLLSANGKVPVTALLANALFADDSSGLQMISVGQYDPGRAGGFNQGVGVTGSTPVNPWNFVLTLEGAVAWAAGIYRRQGISYRSFLCSPFTVRSSPVGYGSAADRDAATARAEIWTPLWSRPARYAEVRSLFREGRASLDSRPARTGLEFAQAASMLGIDRGVTGFVRYGLLKRRGDSFIALPAGRFQVAHRNENDLVRELTPILDRLDMSFRDAPSSYGSLRRQVDEAIYELLLRGGPEALCDVASSFGRLHSWVLTSKPVRLSAALSTGWIDALAGIPEARIAAALAGIWDSSAGSFRDHLNRENRAFAWTGRNLPDRLVRVLQRRLIDAADAAQNPLRSAYNAPISDITQFIDGSLDDELIEGLLFAFVLLNWNGASPLAPARDQDVEVWPVYALIKHLFLPKPPVFKNGGPVMLRSDPRVLSLLAAGDIEGAASIAIRRMLIAGLMPIQAEYAGGVDPQRLAAALLIPVAYGRELSRAAFNAAAVV